MQSDDGSSAYPIETTQTEPEVAPTNPTQICFVPIETGNSYNNYKHTQSKICGAFQIFLGILSIVFNVYELSDYEISQRYGPAIIGHGIWCGVVVSIYHFIYRYKILICSICASSQAHPPARFLAYPRSPARPIASTPSLETILTGNNTAGYLNQMTDLENESYPI